MCSQERLTALFLAHKQLTSQVDRSLERVWDAGLALPGELAAAHQQTGTAERSSLLTGAGGPKWGSSLPTLPLKARMAAREIVISQQKELFGSRLWEPVLEWPRKAKESPPLETLESRRDSHLSGLEEFCPEAGGWTKWPIWVLSSLQPRWSHCSLFF